MKKYLLGLFVFAFAAAGIYVAATALAQSERWGWNDKKTDSAMVSPNLVISQFQPGTSANPNDEFVEIKNISSSPVDLNGYRVVYRSQNGNNDVGPFAVWTTPTILQPGQFYLIASTSYTGSVTPNLTYNPTTCACSMSASNGHLGIRQGDMNTGALIDAVGWGTGAVVSLYEGTRTSAPPSGSSKVRNQNGCQDTDNNANDFATQTPFAPRNMATAPVTCSGTGTTLFATMNGNPSTVSPSGTTLLTVTVVAAITPPSTGITVQANLASIGGSPDQSFFDNGTNGDVEAGDGVYSYLATIPAGTPGGSYAITGAATDAQGRTANVSLTLTVNAPLPNEDPLLFGNPSYATPDVLNENNYLMAKPQYTLSYNRSKATANWVAWRLDTSWLGNAERSDDFEPDPTLPAGWYQVTDGDYSGSGYTRGHMTPSGDRTRSDADNAATFLMTNIVPQIADNNSGPWAKLEDESRALANAGNELYIISGPAGSRGTIAGGRIVAPEWTWKVIMVLPNGSDDLRRVNRSTRVFGVIMSNVSIPANAPWRNYRVTVDQVENLTGYNFFSEVPRQIQEYIESRRDTL